MQYQTDGAETATRAQITRRERWRALCPLFCRLQTAQRSCRAIPWESCSRQKFYSHKSITSVWNWSQQLILKNAFVSLIHNLSNLESRMVFAGIYFQVDTSHFSTEIWKSPWSGPFLNLQLVHLQGGEWRLRFQWKDALKALSGWQNFTFMSKPVQVLLNTLHSQCSSCHL